MTFTFLGTSAGKPTRDRNLSAVAMQVQNESGWSLFDCGEATQHQILKSDLKSGGLNNIFITHLHGDHYYGLFGLIDSYKMEGRTKELFLYAPKGLKNRLSCFMDLSLEKLGFKLSIVEFEEYDTFYFEKYEIEVLPLVHSIESYAFFIKEFDKSNKLDTLSLQQDGLPPSKFYADIKRGKDVKVGEKLYVAKKYLLEPIKGKRVIISGDNAKPEVLGEALRDLDLLVHESTYTKEVYKDLPVKVLHTTAFELGEVSQRYGVKNLIATHISPRYSDNGAYPLKLIEDEIRENYKGNLLIAKDFMTFSLK